MENILVKILCVWGVVSLVLLGGWDLLLAPLFGIWVDEFFREYLILTIAIFSFTLAALLHERR